MKVFQLITFLCLIIYAYQQCTKGREAKKEDCTADKLSSDEKKVGREYCCFAKQGDTTSCVALTKYKYENIKDYIKLSSLMAQTSTEEDISIDCKALYLQISLLSILLLLF